MWAHPWHAHRWLVMRTLWRAAAALGCAVIVLLYCPTAASAHPMPGTRILLDVGEAAIDAELSIPASNLAEASGIDVDLRTHLSADDYAGLSSYVRGHVRPTTPDGMPWTVQISDMRLDFTGGTATGAYKELVVHTVLTPPTGVDMRRFVLGYDAVIHKVVTHIAIVSVRRDGQVDAGNDARQVGTLRMDAETMTVPPLPVDLTDAGAWRGFTGMVVLGVHHILEGTDHLLFLLTLLLPAVLIAKAGQWHPDNNLRRAVRHILTVTVAFTVGHSVALVVSALSRLEIPARPIETLIAVTILVGGAHAIRPLFPGREALVAGTFGLVHGLAFSFTLAELKLSTSQLAISVLGFNLGIEAVQLLLVALALPPLLALATTRAQPLLRVGGSLLVIIAALAWAFDRLGVANPIARTADRAGSLILPITITAAIAAIAVLGYEKGRARRSRRARPALWS